MLDKALELQRRTKGFAITIMNLFRELPRTEEARVIGTQLLRSSTSIAANYRAACRGRSKAEFAAKLGIVVEEADETVFWLELLLEGGILKGSSHRKALQEANALPAIFAASQFTLRKNLSAQLDNLGKMIKR